MNKTTITSLKNSILVIRGLTKMMEALLKMKATTRKDVLLTSMLKWEVKVLTMRWETMSVIIKISHRSFSPKSTSMRSSRLKISLRWRKSSLWMRTRTLLASTLPVWIQHFRCNSNQKKKRKTPRKVSTLTSQMLISMLQVDTALRATPTSKKRSLMEDNT